MKTASGIFSSRSAAEEAMGKLRSLGLGEDQLSLLTPNVTGAQEPVPTTEGEQPGMGRVIGGVVGGGVGFVGRNPSWRSNFIVAVSRCGLCDRDRIHNYGAHGNHGSGCRSSRRWST